MAPSGTKRRLPAEVIDLCSSDTETSLKQESESPSLKQESESTQAAFSARKRFKSEHKPPRVTPASVIDLLDDSDDVDGDVLFVDPPNVPPVAGLPNTTANASGFNGDEVEMVGTKNHVNLPHSRCHCTEKPFQASLNMSYKDRMAANQVYCESCYCYVCDEKASECKLWTVGTMHCLATDAGPRAGFWLSQRQAHRNKTNQPATALTTTNHGAGAGAGAFQGGYGGGLCGNGPWPPSNTRAQSLDNLTKCRHCGWYSRFSHNNFKFSRRQESGELTTNRQPRWYINQGMMYGGNANEINPTGPDDWCLACGRVASERDLGKLHSKKYVAPVPPVLPALRDKWKPHILLGTKTIRFRLRAHDPRKMEKFAARWTENEGQPGWAYDERAMELELFEHRLGRRPALGMIVKSISVLKDDIIPDDRIASTTSYAGAHSSLSSSETEAVLLEHHKDRLLLVDLHKLAPDFARDKVDHVVTGDIRASWDSVARKGKLKVRVFLNPNKRQSRHKCAMTEFLGSWFGIFPFKLTDLVGRFKASRQDEALIENHLTEAHVPPFDTLDGPVGDECQDTIDIMREALVDSVNKAVRKKEKKLALGCGTRSSKCGGTCKNDVDFTGTMRRFFREILPDVLTSEYDHEIRRSSLQSLVDNHLGAVSNHRTLRGDTVNYITDENATGAHNRHHGQPQGQFTSFLRNEELAAAKLDLSLPYRKLMEATKTLDGLMAHCVNLGHEAAPHVDGLTVELLPFQKQSLKWALERETTPGGLQSFFWPKLPSVEQPNTDVYYCPIHGIWMTSKPHLVRGGIIAEQMGLGKTVISLALILRNPAPELPKSGSKATEVPANPDTSAGKAFWDPDLHKRLSADGGKKGDKGKKRGRILSRGTLVVCNVSLVGQWIEEAKSKLEDPGLIYSYHGGNRKRDAKLLAANSIVVTTYETLSSDDTYHRNKSADPDYVPPCDQVRWWRVICDESHVLRNANNGKSAAVTSLVADHKWLVSGTPVNTTLMDLKNQLEFLGIQDVTMMFAAFRESCFQHVKDPQGRAGTGRRSRHSYDYGYVNQKAPWIGHFLFLLRTVMIRHTQSQKYKGTETTLMSLPPKTERTIHVSFGDEDKAAYKELEAQALAFYSDFKTTHHKNMSKYYLQLTQRLTPLRIACAGGQIPLDDGKTDEDDDSDLDEENGGTANVAKKAREFSEYAYTSKLNKLVEELESVRDNDPTSKSLVFSQYTSTLEWLKRELPGRGFQYRTLNGSMPMKQRAKALADFQHDPPTTIFLLSMRAGAVGINLTQANRVFLMEPCFNPASERQAIGRVHRLGQKRPVEVIRLVMKDSVETRIVKMLKKKYGDNYQSNDGAAGDNDGDDQDKKPAAVEDTSVAAPGAIRVGCLNTDKNLLVTEEFDDLFGWKEPVVPPVTASAANQGAAAAAAAWDDGYDDSSDNYDDWI